MYMRVEDLIQKLISILIIYEVYMYSTTKSWKKGIVHKVIEHPEVKKFVNKTKSFVMEKSS
jgi:hypothetical protein